ncbi:alpha/beta hydrolase [Thiocapsa marina]|uniref:Alpha/beta hydrolase fold protein n=1 Tax=Thiocapsa marina 5811 TaxID=768671 RepID=F9UHZ5_9GAMM|nr:alpha/beta fold hydrolase [Thiocapsa marina]EGV16171.1 alpha/beta hydrolase fold protein [Thiocapsa marina 5811]
MNPRLYSAGLALATALAAGTAAAEEVTLTNRGLTLNANLETTGAQWQQGPVVLMTHGTLAHGGMEIMQTLQSALQERGISSLAMTLSLGLDNRSGMYDCAVPHTHLHTDAVGEIGAWLDWLQSQGVEEVALLGHSRGGNQSARFAAEHPDAPLDAVILIAPQTWSEAAAAQDYAKRYGTSLESRLERARQLASDGRGAEMLEPIDFIYCTETAATAAAFLSYYAPDPRMDTPSLIPEIKASVLVIAGSEDDVVDGLVETVQPIADGERVNLIVLDGADHFFRDLYAEEIADDVQMLLGDN